MQVSKLMADNIHVKLPDGSDKEVPKGTTALEIAKGISPRLADIMPSAHHLPDDQRRHLGRKVRPVAR